MGSGGAEGTYSLHLALDELAIKFLINNPDIIAMLYNIVFVTDDAALCRPDFFDMILFEGSTSTGIDNPTIVRQ